jgi:hypothetical protein
MEARSLLVAETDPARVMSNQTVAFFTPTLHKPWTSITLRIPCVVGRFEVFS